MTKKLVIYADGGARGNPGPAGVGAVIELPDGSVKKFSHYLGVATNNQAEYQGVILGLEKAKQFHPEEIDFYLDSELVVKQLNREYKIKDKNLGPLFIKVWNLQQGFKKVNYHHIPREKNREADKLVNQIINEHG